MAGCGGKPAASEPTAQDELREIYRICRGGGKGGPLAVPKDVEEIRAGHFQNVYARGVESLATGRCVLIWSADPSKSPDAANTILAYEKDAPSQGGYVAMLDGSVKKLSADAFRDAPKATP
jgi:hypothetical protein